MCDSLQIILWAVSEPDLEEFLSDICSLNRVTCWLIFIYIFLTSSWVLDSSVFTIHIFWSVSCMSGSVAAFTSSTAAPSPAPDTTALFGDRNLWMSACFFSSREFEAGVSWHQNVRSYVQLDEKELWQEGKKRKQASKQASLALVCSPASLVWMWRTQGSLLHNKQLVLLLLFMPCIYIITRQWKWCQRTTFVCPGISIPTS